MNVYPGDFSLGTLAYGAGQYQHGSPFVGVTYGGGHCAHGNRGVGAKDASNPRRARHVNMALCQAADSGGVNGLLDAVFAKQAIMNCVNLSTALHRLARLTKEDGHTVRANDHRFGALRAKARAELELQLQEGGRREDLDTLPRCWATIAWAYGTLPLRDMEVAHILNIIGQLALPRLTAFKPFELTNLLWAYAKTQVSHRPLFQAARGHIVAHLQAFPPSNLTTVVWAFVTARYQPSGMLYRVTEEFGRRLPTAEVRPVELANLLWGVATAKLHPRVDLLNELGFRALQLLPTFKHQELTITLWALSRLGLRHDNLFCAAARHVCSSQVLHQQVHPQGIANIVWAFEKQRSLGSGVLPGLGAAVRALLPRCLQLLTQTKSQEFACILHGVSVLGTRLGDYPEADILFKAATSVQERLLHQFSLLQCATLYEAVTVFCRSTNPMPDVFANFCQTLAVLCLAKLDAGSPGSHASGSPDCLDNSGEAAGMYAISLLRLASAAASTILPGNADLSGLVLSNTACYLLQIKLDLFSAGDVNQLASAYGCFQDGLNMETLKEALLRAAYGGAAAQYMGKPYTCSMSAQAHTFAAHVPTQCAAEEGWNESSTAPATYFEDDTGFDSSTGGVDIGFAATGFQDTQGFGPAQSCNVCPGTAGSQVPFNMDPWLEQQVFNSASFIDQAANQAPAGNADDSVSNSFEFADYLVNHSQHPMVVKSDILMGANASGTTVSPHCDLSGESKTVVCQEVHDDFFETGDFMPDSHNPSSTNEPAATGSSFPAAYTVKNTFIDFTDPESGSMRAAASKFRTEQPVSIFPQHDTDMRSAESLVQEFKDEIQTRRRDNTSSSAKFGNHDNKTGQSSRKGEKSFFKQLMSATNARDVLGKATSSSKPASSLQSSAVHKNSLPETSDPLSQEGSLATEVKSGACFGNGNLSATVRSDVNISFQQMPPPGLCLVGPSERMEHAAGTEKTEALHGRQSGNHKPHVGADKADTCMFVMEDGFSNPIRMGNHGPIGPTLFGQHLCNSNTFAMSDDENCHGGFTAGPLEGNCTRHPGPAQVLQQVDAASTAAQMQSVHV